MRRYLLFLLLSTLLLVVGQPVLASSPLTLPQFFADEVVVNGLLAPRAFVFTPDGRILIAERGKETSDDINFGSIRVFKNGALLATRALTLDICGDSERGFLGLELDPNFVGNGYVYVYYTRQAPIGSPQACGYYTYTNSQPGPRNRVSRFTMVGDTIAPGTEQILIDNIVTDVGYHNAGDLHFGLDGYLYVSVGEGGIGALAPDTGKLNGKILRIKPDGVDARHYITTGNPYESDVNARTCGTTNPDAGTGPCREVFAFGFRNPFRFTIQPDLSAAGIPGMGLPVVGDVGGGAWEEINQVISGGNFGWDSREGNCTNGGTIALGCDPNQPPPVGFTNPIYAYAHVNTGANSDSAVIGGVFYQGTGTPALDYPSQYRNNYFFADFVRGFIRRLAYNSSTGKWVAQLPEFATGGQGIIGLKTGPDANLYYLAFLDDENNNLTHVSEIRRIRYTNGQNQKPNAKASVNKLNGPVPGTVYTFSAAGSTDPDGNLPLKYTWDFGDGTPLVSTTSLTVMHAFTTAVNRTVTLTAKDYNGLGLVSDPVTLTVYPGNLPATGTLVLNNQTDPNRPTIYFAGDTWGYNASNVTDPDSGTAPTVSWSVVFHHSTHTHPFLPLATTPGTFQIPNQAFETDPNVWFRAALILTDARGQQTVIQRDLLPMTATVTLVTNPAGGQIAQDGVTHSTPRTISRVVGMHVSIGAPDTLPIGPSSFPFVRWSDNGTQLHTIVVPSANTTYTAFYSPTTQPVRNYDTGTLVALTWNRVDWATGYQIQIDDDPGFVQPLHTSTLLAAETLTYTAPALPNGQYYWHVRAKKADGTFGSYGPTESFALVAP